MFESLAANYERYMTLLSERQKLVASNIANVDTPGYHTQDIDFSAAFADASADEPAPVVEPEHLAVKSDGNNVDLDREARLLAENALRYQIATNFARGELADVKLALQDGKG